MRRLTIVILMMALAGSATAQSVEVEAGAIWQTRNDVRIPNVGGTRFAIDELGDGGPYPAGRLYVTWPIGKRQALRLLVAPLTIEETITLPTSTRFTDATFAPGVPTKASYTFNSYRLTWQYHCGDCTSWRWRIGFTAKVRDAEVRLEQNGLTASDDNVGFVPLLHAGSEWDLNEQWSASVDIDALGASQGRAIDLAAKLHRDLGERWRVAAGYRTVEGGADNDEVYSFAWFQGAVISLERRF